MCDCDSAGPLATAPGMGGYPRTMEVLRYWLPTSPGLGGEAKFKLSDIAEIANVVGSVAGTAKGLSKGSGGSSGLGYDADRVAASILPQVRAKLQEAGVNLPEQAVQDVAKASVLDAFGPGTGVYLAIGGAALLLVLLLRR